jgi:hypothetical protein
MVAKRFVLISCAFLLNLPFFAKAADENTYLLLAFCALSAVLFTGITTVYLMDLNTTKKELLETTKYLEEREAANQKVLLELNERQQVIEELKEKFQLLENDVALLKK